MLPDSPHPAATGALRRGLLALVALAFALPLSVALASVHTVEEGDTLSAIAASYGVGLEELVTLNGITDPNYIFIGQALNIGASSPAVAPPAVPSAAPPVPRLHTVASGETLSAIADGYGVALLELLGLNEIVNANYIWVGQVLSLPGAHVPPPPVSREETEAILRAAAAEFGVDQSLILGLAWLESGWNQSMTSRVGAVGVMQLLPETAVWGLEYLAPDATDWETSTVDNVRLGTAVFAHMLAQTEWNVELALAYYYQGWYSIELYGIFEETYRYVENVVSLAREFR